jgi:hypothetical protein
MCLPLSAAGRNSSSKLLDRTTTAQLSSRIVCSTSAPSSNCRPTSTKKMIIDPTISSNYATIQYPYRMHSKRVSQQVSRSFQTHSLEVLVEVLLPYGWSLEVLLVHLLVLAYFRHLKCRFEDINSVQRSADYHLEIDRMIAYLLDLLLSLMQKHQLIRHLGVSLLVLHRHVPNGQSVVLTCHCDHRLLVRLEAD